MLGDVISAGMVGVLPVARVVLPQDGIERFLDTAVSQSER